MSLLEVRDLRKSFGDLKAVDGISFSVNAGEIFGLLGPNGAGKSTTMMMLAGVLMPDSGSIELDGRQFRSRDHSFRRLLGVVPQDLAIYPDLTGRENLRFFGRLYGLRGARLRDRVDFALEATGLSGRANDPAGDYSGGMKRRLNFGVALLHEPRLLILDEPTVGVDPQSRSHLLDGVRKLSAEGMAVIYASHYMEEVQALCHRVAIVDHGKVLAYDTLPALLGRLSADLTLRIDEPPAGLLRDLQGLVEIQKSDDGTAMLIVSRDQHHDEATLNSTLTRILGLLTSTKTHLHAVETHEPDLERLFLQLTGNRLRD